jgi:hypothetical protein
MVETLLAFLQFSKNEAIDKLRTGRWIFPAGTTVA